LVACGSLFTDEDMGIYESSTKNPSPFIYNEPFGLIIPTDHCHPTTDGFPRRFWSMKDSLFQSPRAPDEKASCYGNRPSACEADQ
jgi:hypothetical protein